MGNERKKVNLTDMDEDSIVASFKEERPAERKTQAVEKQLQGDEKKLQTGERKPQGDEKRKEPTVQAAGKGTPAAKGSGEGGGYVRLFIRESPVCARLGKTIYLRKEFHERIQKIIQTIGNNEMSIFSYVDNVLEQHFAAYQDEITEEYRKRSTGLF